MRAHFNDGRNDVAKLYRACNRLACRIFIAALDFDFFSGGLCGRLFIKSCFAHRVKHGAAIVFDSQKAGVKGYGRLHRLIACYSDGFLIRRYGERSGFQFRLMSDAVILQSLDSVGRGQCAVILLFDESSHGKQNFHVHGLKMLREMIGYE